MNRTQIEACPICDTEQIDESIDEFDGVCTACGFVIHDSTNASPPDWPVVNDDNSRDDTEDWMARCRIRNATEQRLAEAFEILETIADRLGVSVELRRDAANVYCEALLAGTTDGRDTTTTVAACVRLASLQAEKPIPKNRLTDSLDIEPGHFRQRYFVLCDELDRTPPTPEPAAYIPFLSDELTVDDEHRETSVQLLDDIGGDQSLVGKDPGGVAAAVLYFVGDNHTQSDVAEAIGVSTETIRNRVAQLRELVTDD